MTETPTDQEIKSVFDTERMAALIEKFAWIGSDEAGGVTRLAFSPEDLEAREVFRRILEDELHLKVRTDSLGNMFGRREGRRPELPAVMTGSHLDSVRNGGRFDGPAGVFSSLEAFRALDLLGIETEHPFELAVLASEEPNEFGISTFGSRGLLGLLKKEDLASLEDDRGRDFRSALAFIGGDLDRIDEAIVSPGQIKCFVELHIEQMPHLDREGKDIGVIGGVTGIYRERITLTGLAAHGGTTPMEERRDALCAAAELILALETAAVDEEGRAVATIGHLNLYPNSINITPEKVVLDAEIRSFEQERIERMIGRMDDAVSSIESDRRIRVRRQVTYDNPPTHFSPMVIQAVQEAAGFLGLKARGLISMAGHDAAHMGRITEAGMIFIPSKDGLSHCPEEFTETHSIVKGAQCLLKTLLILDRRTKGEETHG